MVKFNKAFKKELITTIKTNIKKFIPLTLIIFLGVAFYVGMKSNAPVLENTMINYFDEYQYMDIRIISPIGLTDEELKKLEKTVAEIETIEGGFQEDIIVNLKNENVNEYQDFVISVNSYNLNKKLNKVWILEGREPQASNELLMDSSLGKFGYEIGDTITIEHDNIKNKEYVIVGNVRSPEFISIERGTSSLMNGKIDYFVYIDESNFDYDGLYNRGFIRLNTDKRPFTDDYNNYVSGVIKKIEEASHDIAKDRKDKFIEEKEAEYSKAYGEFTTQKENALKELDNAKNKLNDAENQIKNAESQILSDREINLYLENAKMQLNSAKAQLDSSKSTLDIAKQMVSNFDSPDMDLEYLKDKLSTAQKALEVTNKAIDALNKEISTKQKECNAIEEEIVRFACKEALNGLYDKLDSTNQEAATIKNEIVQIKNMINYFENFGSSADNIKSYLNQMQKEYDAALIKYNNSLNEYNRATKNLKGQMAEARKTLEAKKLELEKAKEEYNSKEKEINDKFFEAENELAKARKQLDSLKTISWYVLDRTYKADYTQYYDDVQRVENISKILPYVFFIVAGLVTGSSITRMVKEERMKIGILKSLGYSNKQVLLKYLYYTGLAAIIGITCGLTFGILIFPKVFATVYTLLYFIPPLKYTVEIIHIIVGVLAALASSVLVAYIVVKGSLVEYPYYLMRPKVEKKQRKTLLERSKVIWKKLSFMKKVTYRNIFRSIGKTLMTILGIAGCTALIIAGFGTRESLAGIVYKQYGRIFKLNGEFFYKDGYSNIEIEEEHKRVNNIPEVKSTLLGMMKLVHFEINKDKKLQVTGIVPNDLDNLSNFITFEDVKTKKTISLTNEGVILTQKLAELLNAKAGSTVTFIDNDNNKYDVKVIGVCKNYIYHYMYMSPEYYKNIFGLEAENNLLIAKYNDNVNEEKVNEKLLSSGMYSNMLSLSDAEEQYDNIMDKFNIVLLVIINCAALLAFVVLYNLAKINISERTREIATLKVLGFKSKEVNNYINREVKLLTFIGIIIGAFFGKILTTLVINTCEVDTIMFDRDPSYVSYIYGILLTIIFSAVINRIVKKDIHKINMVESLKSIE